MASTSTQFRHYRAWNTSLVASLAGACLLVIGFLILFKLFGLTEKSLEAIDTANRALADMRSPEMDDDAKEKALQGHAKRLFTLFFALTLAGLAALLVPASLVWLLEKMDLLVFESVLETALSWPFLIISSVTIVLLFRFIRQK